MIIEVNGHQVEVDDSFADLSPEQQQIELQHITSALPKAEPVPEEGKSAAGMVGNFLVEHAPETGALGGALAGASQGPNIAKNIVEPVVQAGAKKVPGQGVKNYIAATTELPFAGGKDYGTAYQKATIAAGQPVKSRGSQTPIRRGTLGLSTQPETPSFLKSAGTNITSTPSAPAGRAGSALRMGAAGSLGGKTVHDIQQGNYGDAALHGTGALAALAGQSRYKPLRILGNLVTGGEIASGVTPFFTPKKPVEEKAAGGAIQGYAKGKAVKGGLEAVKKLLEPEAKGYLHHTAINPNPLVGTRYETRDLGGLLPVKEMSVEDLKGAMVNTNPWDLTSRNVAVSSVSGKPLTKEYVTHGGHGYARDIEHQKNKIAGASSKEIATRVQNRANEAYKEADKLGGSGKVYTAPGSMGAFSENFALPTTEIYYDLFQQANLPKSVIKQQSDYLRSVPGEKKTFPFSKMPDLDDPDTMNLFEQNPEFRKAFLKLQQFKNNQKLLGVNAEDVSNAMTDKDLLGLPRGYAGHTMIEMVPGAEILPAKSTKTYPFDTQGIYGGSIGHTPIPVLLNRPYEKAFQEIRAKYPDKPEAAIRSMAIGALETRGKGVSEFMDEEAINRIGQYHEGVKQGKVDPRSVESGLKYIKQPGIYAEGGPVGYAAGKKVIDATRKLILPPAENAARTQIIGTLPTYQKAGSILQQQGAAGRGIDFGAGLGEGAKALGKDFDTYEPFAKNWTPTYSNAKDVPSDAYGQLTNLNVLNVVPREARDEIVQDIGRVMQPGGMGIITTRGKDVMNAKGLAGPEPMSVITSRDTYQKGFNKDELEDYLKYMLGDKFDINRLNLGPAGALIKKKAEGGLACMKEGGKTPAWQRKEGKNPEGGLNAAGRASYNRETGGNLKAPQPEGGPRKKSFCARMEGMKRKNTSSATANDPDSRINKSLRKWKC